MGEYRLLARIGEGGMGVVHLARRPGGERVALKVLRPHVVGDDEARARLAREVNSLSRIRSSRVAEIVDADPWADIPYVATRYVPGLSLHDHVREEGPVAAGDLAHFAAELCAALDAVHRVGVLHRDVKPSNVLMEGRNPILIDFGLARVADDPRLTHTGWLLGTPGYLAPEILLGEDATPAADVHSLAATIAFGGLGRAPFGRGPAMAVMDRVRRGEHDLDGLPTGIRAALERALDPDPGRRPSLAELRAWIDPAALESSTRARMPAVGGAAPAGTAGPAAPTAVAPVSTMPVTSAPPGSTAPPSAPAGRPLPPLEARTKVLPDEPTAPERPDPASLMPPERAPYQQPPPPPPGSRPPFAPTMRPHPGLHPGPQQHPGQQRPPYPPPEPAGPPEPGARPRRSAGARLRSGVLLVLLGCAVAACVGLAPWVALGGVAAGTWLLRAGSRAASAGRDRRARRGPRWSDAPRGVLAFPWHAVVALPGTVLLLAWSLLLAASVGLVAWVLGTSQPVGLAAAGAALALGVWTGPGGARVRGPLAAAVRPVADVALAWVVAALLLGALVAGLGTLVQQEDAQWGSSPASLGSDLLDAVLPGR